MTPSSDAPPEGQDVPVAPQRTDRPAESARSSGRIGWKKGLIVIIAVGGVYTLVELRKTTGNQIPWLNALPEALQKAQSPPKAVVLLVHKRDCPVTAELDQTVFNLASTYEWAMGGVPCRLIWEDHPQVVAKYGLTDSPTLLCLNPAGQAVWRFTGYEITPQIRKRFLKYVVGQEDDATYRRTSTTSAPAPPAR